MGAFFVTATSQSLVNSASPVTAMPFTVAAWFNPTAVNVGQAVWSNCISGASNNLYAFGLDGAARPLMTTTAGGSATTDFGSAIGVAGAWHFMLVRWISATNRRSSILVNGAVQHVQGTTSRSPGAISVMAIGRIETSSPSQPFGGTIAEFWITNTDIQPDGAQLDENLFRQLAFGGPFSVPHIGCDVVEYRSLRTDPIKGEGSDVYFGAKGPQTWTNTNAATLGQHPPLPYWYVRPGQNKRVLTI